MAEKVVACTYYTENEGISAIRRLQEMGYDKKDISVLAKDPERFDKIRAAAGSKAEAPKTGAGGAAAGTGGIQGGAGALLVGLDVLVIPGVGPFIAAGPIATALGSIIAGGAAGGIVGTMVSLGVDKGDAEYFENALETGDLLFMARVSGDRYDRVNGIFRYPEEEYYSRYERSAKNPMDVNRDGKAIKPILLEY